MPSQRPEWWEWELEPTPHLKKRMEDRDFTEIELRAMFTSAHGWRPDTVPGRWIIESAGKRGPWAIVVEPDEVVRRLVIITAYPLTE